MATQKEIALFGAFTLGCTFKSGMKTVHMPPENINEIGIKHVCLDLKGFSYLNPIETVVQDGLIYYSVRIWSCPYCGKMYWFVQEISRLFGEQAVMLKNQKKMLEMQGFDTRMIPPESYYSVLMSDEGDLESYNVSYDTLDISLENNENYQQEPVDLNNLASLDNSKLKEKEIEKEGLDNIKNSFDSIDW